MLSLLVPCHALGRDFSLAVGALGIDPFGEENYGALGPWARRSAHVLFLDVLFQVLGQHRVGTVGTRDFLPRVLRRPARGACGRAWAAVGCSEGARAHVAPFGMVGLALGTRATGSVAAPSCAFLESGGGFRHGVLEAAMTARNCRYQYAPPVL